MFGLISLWSARDDAFGPGKPGTMQTAGCDTADYQSTLHQIRTKAWESA